MWNIGTEYTLVDREMLLKCYLIENNTDFYVFKQLKQPTYCIFVFQLSTVYMFYHEDLSGWPS